VFSPNKTVTQSATVSWELHIVTSVGKVAVSWLKIVGLGLAAMILSHETATLPLAWSRWEMCHAHLADVMTDCSLCRLPDYRTANTSNTIARERYALYQIARTIEIPAKISHNYMSTKNPELNTHNCAILFRHTGQCAVLKTAVTHRQARLVITPHR